MSNFAEETKDMNSVEILNYYRNLYHCEPTTTEQGIVAWAINDILPTYVNKKEIQNKAIDEFAERLKNEYENSIGIPKIEVDTAIHTIDKIAEQMKEGVNNA